MTNPMKTIRIEKVTLNVGAGKDQKLLDKSMKMLNIVTGLEAVKTITDKRIAAWGLRKGLPIGCKITMRGTKAREILKRLVGAKDNTLKPSYFDNNGNISFGIQECIDIPDYAYDPEVGILGLQVSITLERPGFRVKKRKIGAARISASHRISKEEAVSFMTENYDIKVDE